MALDDFSLEDIEDEDESSTAIDDESSEPHTLLRAVDWHIIQNAEHLPLETDTIPEDPTLHVRGDVIVADRTRLSAIIAVAISNFGREDVKDLEELTAVEIQKK